MGYLLATLSEADVERERRAVLREQRERGRRNVGWRAGDWHREAMWGRGHPYARLDEPSRSVRRIRLSDVQWFHQRYYGPGNATIAVVSRRGSDEVHALIERYFGGLRGNAPPEIMRPPEVDARAGYHVVQAPVRFERASLTWRTPAWLTRDDAALDVVSLHLEELLAPPGAAADAPRISVGQVSRRAGSEFQIAVQAASEGELRATLEAIVAQVRQLVDDGITEEAFEKQRSLWVRMSQGRGRRPLSYARFLVSTSAAGQPFDIDEEVARFRALTAADVSRVMRRWLALDRMVMFHHRSHVDAAFHGNHSVRRGWWR
ncbi:MAG: insulinase family protein [Myxococcales bacterium]|nr:insulinase family protein [Myxococcales bacterium]